MMLDQRSLSSWLDWLLSLPIKSAQEKFTAASVVAERLSLIHLPCFSITVAGTNGKGSVVTSLERFFTSSDLNVGSITSPHLINFNERIRFNGQPVSDDLICDAFQAVYEASRDLSLSYFSYATLAGLLILKQKGCDVLLIEVGLGGRLDAANVVSQNMTVITNIDFDHCDVLGDTREKIGAEKVAVLEPNSTLIYGDLDCPQSVLDYAEKQQAHLYRLGVDYFYKAEKETWCWQGQDDAWMALPKPKIHLQNAALVLQVLTLCRPLCHSQSLCHPERSEGSPNVTEEILRYAQDDKAIGNDRGLISKLFEGCQVPGRLDLQKDKSWLLLDVAHNPQSVAYLNDFITALKPAVNKVFAVFGMSQDKAAKSCLAAIESQIDQWFLAPINHPKSLNNEGLKALFVELGLVNYSCYSSGKEAYLAVREQAVDADLIIVFGSFLMVGPILAYVQQQGIESGSSTEA